MTFIYKCSRYYTTYSKIVDSIEDAVRRAWCDQELNEAYPLMLIDENGNVIMDHDALIAEGLAKYEEDE